MSTRITKQKGFTIVELLVSIAIFAVVTTFGVTVFLRSLRAQRSVVALIAASDNASLAIEAIAREIRRGRDFRADNLLNSDNATELSFFNADQKEIVYRFDGGANDDKGAIMRAENNTGFYPITANNIVVEDARFALANIDRAGNPILPRITISIRLGASDRDVVGVVNEIHTTVSSRGLNNPLPPGQ